MDLIGQISVDMWATGSVVAILLIALVWNLAAPDILFLGATSILALLGIISPEEAFAGFSNTGVITVAVLFVVVGGLKETGVLDLIGHQLIGRAQTERAFLLRIAGAILPLSAFLNNTPIVAMFMPIVTDWCRRHGVAPSRVLMPLSFIAILGGTCTLIGTSTNLVIHGLMIQNGLPGMRMFEIGWVGIPYALIGMVYLLTLGRRLAPNRTDLIEQLGQSRREYLVEMQVQPQCRLVGQTVEAAGLRRLPGLFLIEIDRNNELIGPVGPEDLIQANDRLVFTGIVSSIIDLEKIPGLIPIADPGYEVSPKQQRRRRLCEAVISQTSPLIGKTIREADFRTTYGAAVVAVHRGRKRVEKKIGDVMLRPGDTLLLQVSTHFFRTYRHDSAFYLVSDVEDWQPVRRDRSWIAGSIFLILMALMTSGVVPIVIASCLAAVLMVATGCISTSGARRSVEWQVIITIGAAFGIGTALQKSGAATSMASFVFEFSQGAGPLLALAALYLAGTLITELITNNAAAILMFPISLEMAKLFHVDPRPFIMALVLSASASFISPMGYQTNMMVYGPGGYRFTDFLRVGGPLNLLLWMTAIFLIPRIWPFLPNP
ncbi:MAG: SLC13 family permease [Verrucomicrobia bacterium]|nr:SLC13 family permease [Verrucomicrobiota bacterium]